MTKKTTSWHWYAAHIVPLSILDRRRRRRQMSFLYVPFVYGLTAAAAAPGERKKLTWQRSRGGGCYARLFAPYKRKNE
jgi:hypothetical protein